MKFSIVVALLAAICAVAKTEDVCLTNVRDACTPNSISTKISCDSRYGGIKTVESKLIPYINFQLTKSYEYLLLATNYGSYKRNRPGFQKLYQGLSDRSFDDTIDMIKQLTRRGGKVDLNAVHQGSTYITAFEVDELYSLASALDSEKQLSDGAFHVYNHALHEKVRDPEMAHYVEEKFLGKQAETIRKLSGYANDLSKMIKESDSSLALFLFDEYLQKQ